MEQSYLSEALVSLLVKFERNDGLLSEVSHKVPIGDESFNQGSF